MENFVAYNPTKLFFGKGVTELLSENAPKYGKKCMIIYGKGSVKKYGYFDIVNKQLRKAGIKTIEFGGIKPNPIIEDVYKAVEICNQEKPDFLLALGGGSVIDSTKIISLAYANKTNAWDIMKYKIIPQKSLPILVVLTIAATGSEMNPAAVIQNHKVKEKIGYVSELIYPKEAYLDPQFTITVPLRHTINGIVDLTAHALESFFAAGEAPLSDRFTAQTILETMEFAPLLLNDLENFDLRARLMWSATVALNGTLYNGRKTSGDWGVHAIGHSISLLFDIPHGETLSVVYPAWLEHFANKIPERIAKLGQLLKNDKSVSAFETAELIKSFFVSINAPTSLNELNLKESDKQKILNLLIEKKVTGMNIDMNENDYISILNKI